MGFWDFLGLESDKQKGMKEQMQKYDSAYSDLQNQKFDVNNRFNGYKPQFGYGDMTSELDKLLSTQTGQLNRDAASTINSGNRDLGQRLASQGMTGGAAFNQMLNNNRNQVNSNKFNALSNLLANRQNQNVGLMNTANQNQFNIAQAGQQADFGNAQNRISKAGMLNQLLMGRQNSVNQLDDTTWLDDILGIANTGANLYRGFMGK